jgi:5,10-methylenetetrahydromethanopterin reductase
MNCKFGILELPRSIKEALEHARLAERVGFDLFGVGDSQSLFREAYTTMAAVAGATTRVQIGVTVTNLITRHPAVTASAIATINEISGGRAMLGIGTGDSAILNLGLRPFTLDQLREAVQTLKPLLRGQPASWRGNPVHAEWITGKPVPIYIAAEGPKTLELAGEIADGVICGLGLSPEVVDLSLTHLEKGARRAGRSLESLDIWALARVNVGSDRQALMRELRMEYAASVHHAFRARLEGKAIPARFVRTVERVKAGYQTRKHESFGEANNARLIDDPDFLEYMTGRFAVLGSPEDCVRQIKRIRTSGIGNMLFTGFVQDRPRLIEALGTRVLAQLR